jgi:hypothetical protein
MPQHSAASTRKNEEPDEKLDVDDARDVFIDVSLLLLCSSMRFKRHVAAVKRNERLWFIYLQNALCMTRSEGDCA